MRSPLDDRYLSALIAERLARSPPKREKGFEFHCGQEYLVL